MEAGCDLLDIKEPSRGALGRADRNIVMDIVKYRDRYSPQIPISIALGELCEESDKQLLMPGLRSDYQKWGTSNFQPEFIPFIPDSKKNVGVYYVDYQNCGGINLPELLKIDELFNSGVILFDTFNKADRGLLDILSKAELSEQTENCRQRGLEVGLAGKIRLEQIESLLELDFQILALRSAVCKGNDRKSELDQQLIVQIKKLINS